jgi:hypothetical protein
MPVARRDAERGCQHTESARDEIDPREVKGIGDSRYRKVPPLAIIFEKLNLTDRAGVRFLKVGESTLCEPVAS